MTVSAERQRAARAKARERGRDDPTLIPHGTLSGHQYWGCRCPLCVEANMGSWSRWVQGGRPAVVDVEGLLLVPAGTILADRHGSAVQRIASGAFWVAGERWPHLAREIADRGPFRVVDVPKGARP